MSRHSRPKTAKRDINKGIRDAYESYIKEINDWINKNITIKSSLTIAEKDTILKKYDTDIIEIINNLNTKQNNNNKNNNFNNIIPELLDIQEKINNALDKILLEIKEKTVSSKPPSNSKPNTRFQRPRTRTQTNTNTNKRQKTPPNTTQRRKTPPKINTNTLKRNPLPPIASSKIPHIQSIPHIPYIPPIEKKLPIPTYLPIPSIKSKPPPPSEKESVAMGMSNSDFKQYMIESGISDKHLMEKRETLDTLLLGKTPTVSSETIQSFLLKEAKRIQSLKAINPIHIVETKDEHFSIFPTFYQSQETGMGCGRFALNNLLGGQYFAKNGPDITDELYNDITKMKVPISLDQLCKYYYKFQFENTDNFNELKKVLCPDYENYDVNILQIALKTLGYNVKSVHRNYNREFIDHEINLDTENPNFIGFICNRGQGHWVCCRKTNYKFNGGIEDVYLMIDSSRPEPTMVRNIQYVSLQNIIDSKFITLETVHFNYNGGYTLGQLQIKEQKVGLLDGILRNSIDGESVDMEFINNFILINFEELESKTITLDQFIDKFIKQFKSIKKKSKN